MRRAALAAAAALMLLGSPAAAIDADEMFDDPALEARAVAISKQLRCLVCQNQSIFDSNAGLARDLRKVVRERIAAGEGDAATIDYIVERYGDYVLLDPPVKASTVALWATPWVFLVSALALGVLYLRRRNEPRINDADADVAIGRRMLKGD